MTYRDRRIARAERLTEWADKREAKAEAELARADQMGTVILSEGWWNRDIR